MSTEDAITRDELTEAWKRLSFDESCLPALLADVAAHREPEDDPPAVPDEAAARFEAAIAGAFAASNAWARRSRAMVFVSPSKDQVRMMIQPEFNRAEAAEARLAAVRELAMQLVTASHPTVGGTFAAGIGHKFLAIIDAEEETRDG